MEEEDISALWLAYRSQGDFESRNQLAEYYLPVVRRIAERLYFSLNRHVELEELFSSGVLGLLDAISRYTPSKQVKFETFSALRIKGAMLDEIRHRDWVPRNAREANNLYNNTRRKLMNSLCKEPSQEEMMEALHMDEKAFYELCLEANVLNMLPLSLLEDQNDNSDTPTQELTQDDRHQILLSRDEKREVLKKSMASLPERQQAALVMYYHEEMSLKEIAAVLEVSEGRVSQILSSSLLLLRGQLKDLQEDLFKEI